jgi:hypothetical protein
MTGVTEELLSGAAVPATELTSITEFSSVPGVREEGMAEGNELLSGATVAERGVITEFSSVPGVREEGMAEGNELLSGATVAERGVITEFLSVPGVREEERGVTEGFARVSALSALTPLPVCPETVCIFINNINNNNEIIYFTDIKISPFYYYIKYIKKLEEVDNYLQGVYNKIVSIETIARRNNLTEYL